MRKQEIISFKADQQLVEALILAAEEEAKAIAGDRVVWLDGVGCATASMSVLKRPDLTGIPSAQEAARQAYAQAGVTAPPRPAAPPSPAPA